MGRLIEAACDRRSLHARSHPHDFVLTLFGLNPLLAQDQGKSPVSGSQSAQAQGSPSVQINRQSNDASNERRVMERMGPGMDWDHRKPGRDLRMSPRREDGDVKRERE